MIEQPVQKKKVKISPLEVMLFLVGGGSLVYGLLAHVMMNIFWGCVIIPGIFLLRKIKQKDWQAHWDEMERYHKGKNAEEYHDNKE